MKRKASLLKKSKNGRKALYIDVENGPEILKYLNDDPSNLIKFNKVVGLILEGGALRALYDKENFEKGCEHVTAIKLFKGKKNPRIYCQQYADKGKQVFVIVIAELLVKKTSQGLSKRERTIIRRVAKYEYDLS